MFRLSRNHTLPEAPRASLASVAVAVLLLAAAPLGAATFDVAGTADSPDQAPGDGACADPTGLCTLRAAVMEANALAGADVINLPAGTYTISIVGALEDASATGDLDITEDLDIVGEDTATTIIDAGGAPWDDRVLDVRLSAGQMLTMSDFTVTGGFNSDGAGANWGGGIRILNGDVSLTRVDVRDNWGPARSLGGGVYIEDGVVTILECTIDSNQLPDHGGNPQNFGAGISVGDPGFLPTNLDVLIERSTISRNSALRCFGGGLHAGHGTTRLINSTVALNTASENGGGIEVSPEAALIINNSTIAGNTCNGEQGTCGSGGGIYVRLGGTVTMSNTIVGDNTPDINDPATNECPDYHGELTSLGYNIIEGQNAPDDPCCVVPVLTGTDFTGDAGLEQGAGAPNLRSNGGPTETIALYQADSITWSQALDTGEAVTCEAEDQRVYFRPAEGDGVAPAVCDRGAYEGCSGPPAVDPDRDRVADICDNCPTTMNPDQLDTDADEYGDACDNCPDTPNGLNDDDQANADGDAWGDACDCDPLNPGNPDPGPVGNTLRISNDPAAGITTLTWDPASGGVTGYNVYRGFFSFGRAFEYNHYCVEADAQVLTADDTLDPLSFSIFYYLVTGICGIRETESGGGDDSQGNPRPAAGFCPERDPTESDRDLDGIENALDNCPDHVNAGQEDADSDGVGDVCDNCVNQSNPGQEDQDGDCGAPPYAGDPLCGDLCDPDRDGDGIDNVDDNCPTVNDPDQTDTDADGWGDICDNCPDHSNDQQLDSDVDGVGNVCDNCWFVSNPAQDDTDSDCPAPPYALDPECGDRCDP